MLFTVDLIFHNEKAFSFQAGATVGAHTALRVAVTVLQLYKHTDKADATFFPGNFWAFVIDAAFLQPYHS